VYVKGAQSRETSGSGQRASGSGQRAAGSGQRAAGDFGQRGLLRNSLFI